MGNRKILIVDDEPGMRQYLDKLLVDAGYTVGMASDGESALEALKSDLPDFVLLDLKMPKMDGMAVLKEAKKIDAQLPIIIMTAFGTMEIAVEAMKLGAYDFINKPFDMDQILLVISKALEKRKLEEENFALRRELEKSYTFEDIVSQNQEMHKIFETVEKISNAKSHVLVQGETGTGKELIARAIHNISHQKDKPFVPVDCGALTETLLESELFGHVKGAFTGATADKKGLFELAEGGTAFLDEVGQISLGIQAKLLRVLQDGEIKRVGEAQARKVNVRLIAAANEKLEGAVKRGTFREDLFYRLNVVLIELPPLRDRKEDIPILCDHFIKKYNGLEQKSVEGISNDALNILINYNWPGNIRELENLIHRIVVMESSKEILAKDLPASMQTAPSADRRDVFSRTSNFKKAREMAIESFERSFLENALRENKGNVSHVAKAVGLDRRNLQRKFKLYKINPKDYV